MKKAVFFAALVLLVIARIGTSSAQVINNSDKVGSVDEVATIAVVKTVAQPSQPKGNVKAAATTEPAPEPQPDPEVYVTVQSGDTLISIAEANGTTYRRLFDGNTQISNPNVINPGDQIRIPRADEQLAERELPAAAPVVAVATTSMPVARTSAVVTYSGDMTVWDQLAACESGGNWAINTGNGYYGGLQFNYSTWLSNGGGTYAERADLATREQQIEIASKVAAGRGFAPWPACARKLGLL